MNRKVDLRTTGRNLDWSLYVNEDGTWNDSKIQIALLHDIRDELRRLNNVLQCPNFISVPSKLDAIVKNTRKKRKPRVVGKPKLRVVTR